MAGPPPRKKAARKGRTRPARAPAAPVAQKRRPTRGERTAAREERRRTRRAHRVGMRAVRREQWDRIRAFVAPPYTRDVGRPKALLVLVLNIVPFPGLGTALYGQVARGVAQFLLTFLFLVGWLWAIADGARIVRAAYAGSARPSRQGAAVPPRRRDG